mgnify:FL=1
MGGNTIIQQRRGKGKSSVYIIPDHYSKGKISFRKYDEREKNGVIKGVVEDIIKDSVHYAPLMVIKYEDGSKIVLPAVEGIYVGKEVYAGKDAPIDIGNILPLRYIPEGTQICCVEINPGDGGKIARSSGSSCILIQKTDKYALIKLPSGKTKEIPLDSRAMIGIVAGGGRTEKPFVKAGTKYYYMKAHHRYWPIVAAVAKNVADHPFGGKHKRNKGGNTPLPKHGYPIKYGYYGSRKTGRGKKGSVVGTKKEE